MSVRWAVEKTAAASASSGACTDCAVPTGEGNLHTSLRQARTAITSRYSAFTMVKPWRAWLLEDQRASNSS
jgi:hypothetical protein